MAAHWLRQYKGSAILTALFCLIASLHYILLALAPIAHWVEARLLAAADTRLLVVMMLAISCYHLWLIAKALVFQIVVIGLTFVIERQFSDAERERKDYLAAALVQTAFLSIGYAATLVTSKFIPLSGKTLFNLPESGAGLESILWTLGAVGAYLIAFDILLYWTHRLHHAVPVLWKFHAVHHSPNDLDALHNFVHPAELMVRYFTIVIPLSLIIHIDQFHFYAVFTFLAVQNQLNHMNVPMNFGFLGAVLVDNRHHFIHHSPEPRHYGRNYAAIFSFTDRIFGTYQHSEGKTLTATGFDAAERPATLADHILARKNARKGPQAKARENAHGV